VAGGGKPPLDCNIVDQANLGGPDLTVLKTVSVRDQLSVELRRVANREVIAAIWQQQMAGTIMLSSVDRTQALIDCLRQGKRFVATVLSIKGALCLVEIRPKP
jgi:hypothetical protein